MCVFITWVAEQRDVLKKGKLLLKKKKYSDKQTQTICVYRKFTDEDYAIWVKMIDLQKRSCHRNLKNTNGFMTIKVYTSVKILLID